MSAKAAPRTALLFRLIPPVPARPLRDLPRCREVFTTSARCHDGDQGRRPGSNVGPRSFGSPGAGGALGFADPDAGVGYGSVTSRMGTVFTGDPRDRALRDTLRHPRVSTPGGG
jgi:CubicO group peptidase (beta-lactamase class C family)